MSDPATSPEETDDSSNGLSRRRFLSLITLAAGGAGALAILPGGRAAGQEPPREDEKPEDIPWAERRRVLLDAHDRIARLSKGEEE